MRYKGIILNISSFDGTIFLCVEVYFSTDLLFPAIIRKIYKQYVRNNWIKVQFKTILWKILKKSRENYKIDQLQTLTKVLEFILIEMWFVVLPNGLIFITTIQQNKRKRCTKFITSYTFKWIITSHCVKWKSDDENIRKESIVNGAINIMNKCTIRNLIVAADTTVTPIQCKRIFFVFVQVFAIVFTIKKILIDNQMKMKTN